MEQNQIVSIFKNEEFGEVRTVKDGDKILFCGSDVAKALGYSNPSKALGDHCKGITKRYIPHPQSQEKQIEMSFITEGDIYRLVARSKLASAERFESWVFDDVLPQLRKTGTYGLSAIDTATLRVLHATDPMEKALALADFRDAVAAPLKAVIEEQKPKVTYYDVVMQSDDVVPITVIAKDYGLSARKLNSMLKEWGVQYKQGQQWFLYAKYAGCGYMHSVTTAVDNGHVFMNSQWTQKGRKFIYDIMKENGYLPLIEKEEEIA